MKTKTVITTLLLLWLAAGTVTAQFFSNPNQPGYPLMGRNSGLDGSSLTGVNATTATNAPNGTPLNNLAHAVTNNQPFVQFGEVDSAAGDYMFAGTIQDAAGDYLNDGRIQDVAGDYMFDGGFSTYSGDFRTFAGVTTTGTNNAAAFNGGIFTGNGSGLTFTNAAGKSFRLIVNSSTNGFSFVAQ